MKEPVIYYYVPVWMSIAIDGLITAGLARRISYIEETPHGAYKFNCPFGDYGDNEGQEDIMVVWNAKPEKVEQYLKTIFPDNVKLLVNMAEEYARERGDRKEVYVYRCIVQLLIVRAVELTKDGETLVINGNISLVGRLPEKGRLRVNGKVDKVEGSTGTLLQVQSEHCPRLERPSSANKSAGVWTIWKEEPNLILF